MQNGWLSRAGAWPVEHVPCPNPGATVNMAVPPKGVQHTTEGSTIEGALAEFKQKYAPHFLVGPDQHGKVRVLQLVPLGVMSSALVHQGDPPTNGYARAQIELAGFSRKTLWKPDAEVCGALGSLWGALAQTQAIPLLHVANANRDPHTWTYGTGWFGHDGIPGNTHWDPGALDWEAVFAHATRATPVPPKVKPKPRPMILQPRTYTLVRRSTGAVEAVQIDRPH